MSDTSAAEGTLLMVRKPKQWTSFDVVREVRRILGAKKAGHAGTLDPLATGLLIVGTGRRTRELGRFQDLEKEYQVVMVLGARTSSFDAETAVTERFSLDGITEDVIRTTIGGFVGEQRQVPPMYSAVKVQGRRLYKYARRGVEVERPPRPVFVRSIGVTALQLPRVSMTVVCSKGTYVRTLVDDIGLKLGCGAYVEALERTRIGGFRLEDAWSIEDLHRRIEGDRRREP
jgi:tRNA pseudouridine55 synthase